MFSTSSEPGTTARKFVYDGPESRRSRFARFLVQRVLKLGQRYDKLVLSGPGFDRSKMMHAAPKPGQGVSVTRRMLGASAYFELRCGKQQSAKVIYYLHGGAFIEGPAIGHAYFVRDISKKTQTDLVLLDYPKAPEHSAAQMLATVHEMYQRLCASYGARNIIVMGDSAGATLTLALAHLLKQQSAELPAKLILLSPTLDIRYENPAMREIEPDDPFLSVRALHAIRKAYLSQGGDPMSPLISPIFVDLKGLPPIYLFSGTHDVLTADARKLFGRAQAEGARMEYYEFPKMMHVWMLFTFAEAQAARERICEIIQAPEAA